MNEIMEDDIYLHSPTETETNSFRFVCLYGKNTGQLHKSWGKVMSQLGVISRINCVLDVHGDRSSV